MMKPASTNDDWNVRAVYDDLTEGRTRNLRLAELVDAAAAAFPGLVPSRDEMRAERARLQRDKVGCEVDHGAFISCVLADPIAGRHLLRAMAQPTQEALVRHDAFCRTGCVDLGPVRVDRVGAIGLVTLQNHAHLNAEDDASTAALEVAVDLVILDDEIEVGVLRGGVATHPKHAGRRIFGSGINLTHLYEGKISLINFMLDRELGSINKMYRGLCSENPDDALAAGREKPWIAVVDSFAIGGACQWLLVMDRVIAEESSSFTLPARKEGIIPGCAALRLPRIVGDRLARQMIFFGRGLTASSNEGRLIADEVVPGDDADAAMRTAATELMSAGMTSLVANRRAMRAAQEPVDAFREYMSLYAREQARCLTSPKLIDNLERNWTRRDR